MARLRVIRPEFWTDDRIGECSPQARLLFIATWNFADDHGGLDRSAKQLKAQAFPYDDLDVEPLVQELLRAGVLVEYEAVGKKYLHIKNFGKHQKVENPSNPRVPIWEGAAKSTRDLTEKKPSPRRALASESGLESGKGKEGRGATELALAVPGLDLKAWEDWSRYRTQIRKPLKPVSIPLAQQQMAALGLRQREAVDYTIGKGWTGLRLPDPREARGRGEPDGVDWRPTE